MVSKLDRLAALILHVFSCIRVPQCKSFLPSSGLVQEKNYLEK